MTHKCEVVQKGTPTDYKLEKLDRDPFGELISTGEILIEGREALRTACSLYVEIVGTIDREAQRRAALQFLLPYGLGREVGTGESFVLLGHSIIEHSSHGGRLNSPHEGLSRHEGLARIEELRDWTGLSYDRLAKVVGVATSTVFAWKSRPDSRPQAKTVAHLVRLHFLLATIVQEDGPAAAASWFLAGDPSPYDLLSDDFSRISTFEDEVFAPDLDQAASRVATLLRLRRTGSRHSQEAWGAFAEGEGQHGDPLRGERSSEDQL